MSLQHDEAGTELLSPDTDLRPPPGDDDNDDNDVDTDLRPPSDILRRIKLRVKVGVKLK